MNYDEYIKVQQRRGRAGGLATARKRRNQKLRDSLQQHADATEREALWPRCDVCGNRKHLNFCSTCDR